MQGTIAIMVMRSSLDPLEEARARIRLRHARAKPVKPIAKTIGTLSQRITRDRLPKKGPAIGRLKLVWAEIVGPQISRVCEPEKIGSGGKGKGRVLTVQCIPAAATMIQHQSELIRQRVSVSLGGDIAEIRIKQGPLSRQAAPKPVRALRPLTPEERASLEASVARIEDRSLREAVLALGEAVLATEERTQEPDRR
ncbi:MAG: hypothetical protein CME85_06265 [Henriciella sp.]|nr:hypothetical protein [Henriciella sp.]